MLYFSARQRLHRLVFGEYGLAFSTMLHVMVYLRLAFFNSHMCSLKDVADCLCCSRKLELCWLYLVLNWFSVIPMYVSIILFCSCTTVAWYTTPSWRHLPLSGHALLSLQLHDFFFSSCSLLFRIVWLWLSMICFMLFMQL